MEKPDNIKVELVEHSPGAPFTGIGRYTRELYRHLLPHVSVRLTTHNDPPLSRTLSFLHHFPVGVRGHEEGSIVHFMEDLGCSQMWWRPIRPAIATSHDLGMLDWAPEAKMHRPWDRLILLLSYFGLKRMDAVITDSEYARQTVIRRLRIPAERVFTVHHGTDHTLFRPVAGARGKLEARYGLPGDGQYKYLLYVGSEFPRKNLATLLKALYFLPPHVRLLKVGVAGGKRFRTYTNRLITKYGLEDRISFLERVPEEDLPLFYNAADVYVSASFLEGFGHPIVEAMACGTPIVCSNVASLPEVTGAAALLAPPSDAQAFADAVSMILDDATLHEQMATRALRQAAKFSWERTAAGVAAVYRRVACGEAVAPLDLIKGTEDIEQSELK